MVRVSGVGVVRAGSTARGNLRGCQSQIKPVSLIQINPASMCDMSDNHVDRFTVSGFLSNDVQ